MVDSSVGVRGDRSSLVVRLFAVVVLALGAWLVIGGLRLVTLGGSAYYVIGGGALLAAGISLWRRRVVGVGILLVFLVATGLWAIWEVGFDFWPLFPRLLVPALLALVALLLVPQLQGGGDALARRKAALLAAGVLVLGLLGVLYQMFQPHGVVAAANGGSGYMAAAGQVEPSDWTHYGREPAGTRFAPFGQITRDNVDQLELAWTFRSEDLGPGDDQNTPLQIGDTIYTCSRSNRVAALDADTGEVRWRFDPQAKGKIWQRCRGVGYHAATPAPGGAAPQACARRIVLNTNDARLITLDADSGKPCEDFGVHGEVDLAQHMGEFRAGWYFLTSAPTVARNLVILGGYVADNQARGEPSGVVRAFDVTTGALVWAWDLGNPAITREPPPGEFYTRGTPNMWSTPSFDDALGLVYLPLGNPTPDYWGAGRSPESERYTAAVVALDIDTGRERWHFQTVHHDLWDYDLPAQPALYDLPDGQGGSTPALVLPTKRGQLFFLNRATGEPIAEVKELPVPQSGQAQGEWLAKTQPYSTGMPAIGAERLTEQKMWGISPVDQLWCRIRYRTLRYEGDFTPPSLAGTIQYPGNAGGMNWGSIAIDGNNGYAFINDLRVPTVVTLLSQEDTKAMMAHRGPPDGHGPSPQAGTPYGVNIQLLMSPIGVPCPQPPYGTLTAVDLKSRKVAWQVPIATTQDTGPLGIRTHLKMPVGMPTVGGPVATATGVVFFAGTQDFYLRAFDAATGVEIWRERLPVGAGGTPMTYVSPKTGRQYVLVSAGGARYSPTRGDYVLAYALPAAPAR